MHSHIHVCAQVCIALFPRPQPASSTPHQIRDLQETANRNCTQYLCTEKYMYPSSLSVMWWQLVNKFVMKDDLKVSEEA